MKGLLKAKPAGNQFLVLIAITLASMIFIGALLGTIVMSAITGISSTELLSTSKSSFSTPGMVTYLRGLQLFQFIGLFLVPSFFCARLFSEDSKNYLGFRSSSNPLYFLMGAIALLVALPLTGYLGELNQHVQFPEAIAKWMKSQEEDAAKTVSALLSKHSVTDLILNLFFIAGLAAVGEELLFRGMMQRILIKWFKSPWIGIVVAAFLFSASHVQFYGFLPRFVLGILLGAAYWYSNSLWVAILAHFVYDGLLIVLVYLNPASFTDENPVNFPNMTVAALFSLALVSAIVWWMKKRSVTKYTTVYAEDLSAKNHPFDFEGNTPV